MRFSGHFAEPGPVCDKGRMNTSDYLDLIRSARVYDVADETPLDLAANLSARLGNRVLMKREDLQPVFSFKLRGAYNKIASLPDNELRAGVICSSAGNHAQGVALAAKRRGVRAVIVMPVTTPSIKTEAVTALGGEVVLHGDTYDDAYARACRLADEEGLVFIHPFDDPQVIAGQGTIGREILEQCDETIDALFVPVGGGGLIAGIAAWVKQTQPDIRIIGVEPEDSAAMQASLQAGHPVTLDHVGIQTTSLLAVFGAAGLAIGLALKDSLGNFSSGVMIILFRPFKVGDFIEAGGATGVVEQVRMFATILRTGDNREIILPNSQVYGGMITNFSAKATRRIDLVFGIGYDDDIGKARQIIADIMQQDSRILADPEPSIALGELGVHLAGRADRGRVAGAPGAPRAAGRAGPLLGPAVAAALGLDRVR